MRGLARIALAVTLGVLWLPRPARAQDTWTRAGDLDVQVELGFDGRYVEGGTTWTPVAVTLQTEPRSAPLSGRVVLEAQPLQRVAWFAAPFELPASPTGARTRVVLGVPSWSERSFAVKVEDARGREVPISVAPTERLDAKDRLVLGTRGYGLAAFADPQQHGGGQALVGPIVRLVHASDGVGTTLRDRIPVRPELLSSLTAVILADGPGVPELVRDPERTAAFEEWIHGGGTLVVVGGAGTFWRGTPVEEWLPVTVGARAIPITLAPGALESLGEPRAWGSATDAQLRGDATLLAGSPAHALVAARDLGRGRVVFVAFDPNSGDLRGSAEVTRFLHGILAGTAARNDSVAIPPERLARLSAQAWDEVAPLSVPGLAGVALAALVAAAIAGPVAARRRGRPDRIWVAPLLSAGLAGVVVAVAGIARGPSEVRRIAWVFVDPGGGTGTVVEDTALFSGGERSFELELAPGALPLELERPKVELVDFERAARG